MKRICFIMGWVWAVLCGACTEDKGNYDYMLLNNPTIGGLEKKYLAEQFSALKIPVEVTVPGSFEANRYDYLWYCWRVNNAADPDTLSHEKDLNVELAIAPGNYLLRFLVKDRETELFYSAETELDVVNSVSKGVMVLSEVEGNAAVTFINIAGTVTENAYRKVNGTGAGTSPRGIFYIGGGEYVKGMIAISTGEGTRLVEPLDFSDMLDFSDLFYFSPTPGRMECLCKCSWEYDEYVIVDGKVYNRRISFVDNFFQKYDPYVKGDYEAAPFSMYEADDAFFYDRKGKRFMYDDYGTMIPVLAVTGAFNPADMKADMLYGAAFEEQVRAVMEEANGSRYAIMAQKKVEWSDDYEEKYIQVIPLRRQPLTGSATCYAVSAKENNFLYCASGNRITCIGMETGNALAEYTITGGGTIDYMEFDRAENPERLYVGVSDGSGSAQSGSIYYLNMNSDGSLEKEAYFEKVCGKVVDFEYKP